MSSFLSIQPPAAGNPAPDPESVENDGWFPAIDCAALREAMRLDGTVTAARLVQAVVAAILHVNAQLAEWQAVQQAAGHAALAEVPAPKIAAESRLLALYRRAVYSTVKADLIERYRDYDTTAEGNKKAELLESPIDEQRRNAHWAIAGIVGRTHVTVELI